VKLGDDYQYPIKGVGEASYRLDSRKPMKMKDVLYVPGVAVLIHTWGNVEETFNPLSVSLGASLESKCCHLILNSSV
jgi:hypothetical protein